MRDIFILSAKRTPIGSFLGSLEPLSAPQLGSVAIAAALKESGLSGESVGQVYMGNVLTAGVGQAPARQASMGAGLPNSVGATTINKVCGSGLMSVHLASQAIRLGEMDAAIAGGMESMSNSPFLIERARQGLKFGHAQLVDCMIRDGLWDVYNDFHMGCAAELCAREKSVSRQEQDDFATMSYERALESMKKGLFNSEIIAVEVQQRRETISITEDEEPKRFQPEKISTLKPAFDKEGTITAANASSINDGAAALVLASKEGMSGFTGEPLAKISGFANAPMEPEWFTIAPVKAVQKLLHSKGLTVKDIDLFEINEAFSVVAVAVARALEISMDRVNVRGGAVALGHPIGASGARILATLLHTLKETGKKRGVAAICLGGGEAVAMLVERE